jgi:glycosyltransferase involved in cell wall biosynthesis
MRTLGIDGSNISSGGGLSHLSQLLSAARPYESNFKAIHLWTSSQTARKLPKRDWLVLHTPRWCDAGLARRMWSQQFQLPTLVKHAGCHVLLSPGGTLPAWSSVPMVTMCQNMLPFEPDRAALFGRWSSMRLKMRVLRTSQGRSFRRAHGVIFLTRYARDTVTTALGCGHGASAIIAHGIESRFIMRPRPQKSCRDFDGQPLRLLYVSIQMPYKHHLEVMQAVTQLRHEGLTVVLQMVGANAGAYGEAVQCHRLALDPHESFLHDLGYVDFGRLHELYRQADIFLFASSCENLPNILIEAMAAGLPIACSDRGPMPEVLGDAGEYFDPESPASITSAIEKLADDPTLRAELATRAWRRAHDYSWERCARETLDFVSQVALQHR